MLYNLTCFLPIWEIELKKLKKTIAFFKATIYGFFWITFYVHYFGQHTSVDKEKIPAFMVLSFLWKRQTTITKKYPDDRVC